MIYRPEGNALRRFERKVLRKIYGPVVDKGIWRIRYNNELFKLMGGEDIGRFIKAQRIHVQWLDHVERMDGTGMPKRVLRPCGEDGWNWHAQKSAERETVRNEKNRKT